MAAGYKIVVHTSRSWTDFENIEKWCKHNDIPAKHIVPGKLLAAVYVDDRALNDSESSWMPEKAKVLHEYGAHRSMIRQEFEAHPLKMVFPAGDVWDKRTNGQPASVISTEVEDRKQELVAAHNTMATRSDLQGIRGLDNLLLAVRNFVHAVQREEAE